MMTVLIVMIKILRLQLYSFWWWFGI